MRTPPRIDAVVCDMVDDEKTRPPGSGEAARDPRSVETDGVATLPIGPGMDAGEDLRELLGDIPSELLRDPDLTYAPGRTALLASLERRREGEDDASPAPDLRFHPDTGFVLRDSIARGGFGDVWVGTQSSLRREVAIKRIREDLWLSADDATRKILLEMFRAEAVTTARLEHPNIVPVHDLGADDEGRPLLAMKRVRGRPWTKILREAAEATDPEEALRQQLGIFVDVAQALAYSHSRGVLHLDLKPHQVMVGEFGEVYLMDWGLAAGTDAPVPGGDAEGDPASAESRSGGRASTGGPSGTPSFMAPELARDDTEAIGPATDLYLLGGTLYYLLAGSPPHQEATTLATLAAAARGRVVPPSVRSPDRLVPSELEELALGLLAPEPEERTPSSVSAVIRAVEEFLAGVGRRRRSVEISSEVATALDSGDGDYRGLAQHLERLRRARELWPDNRRAEELRDGVLARYGRAALSAGDLALARLQADSLPEGRVRQDLHRDITLAEDRRRATRRQRRVLLGSTSILGLLLVLGAIAFSLGQRRASEALREQRDLARSARAEAEDVLRFLMEDLSESLFDIDRSDLIEPAARLAADYYRDRDRASLTSGEALRRADSLASLGSVFALQGDLDSAAEHLAAAIEAYRDVAATSHAREISDSARLGLYSTLAHRGGVLRDGGDHEGARRVLEEAMEEIASLDESLRDRLAAVRLELSDHLGILEYDRGHLERAEELFRTAAELAARVEEREGRGAVPSASGILMRLAVVLHDRGRPSGALEQIDAALERLATDEDSGREGIFFVTIRSEILRALDRPEEAAESLRPWSARLTADVAEDPRNVERRYARALLELELGQAEAATGNARAAREAWQRVVDSGATPDGAPELLYLLDCVVRAHLRLEQVERARPLAERLLEADWTYRGFRELVREHGLDASPGDPAAPTANPTRP